MSIFTKQKRHADDSAPNPVAAEAAAARLRVREPDAVAAIEAHARTLGATAERDRVLAIFRLCQTTNQLQTFEKLIVNGTAEDPAIEYIMDVAAAYSDATAIVTSHSPEGGHSNPLDTAELYANRNRGLTK